MTVGIWILGDQLWQKQAALSSCEEQREQTPIIFIESQSPLKIRSYHQQKLVLIWSAMRHFAQELEQEGWQVTYAIAEAFESALQEWIQDQKISELRIMMPNDRPFLKQIKAFELDCKLNFIPNNQFIWNTKDFQDWANSRKRLLLEDFYREGRKRFNILMEGKQPVGQRWNFDKDNRQPPKGKMKTPSSLTFSPDKITQEVIEKVNTLKEPTYGQLDNFSWGVTRDQALAVLDDFITHKLSNFGAYQDAMVTEEKTLWHSLLSPYLNLGLLHPTEVIEVAENAYYDQDLPLNSVEGFIRQLLGWREYLYGLYHWVEEDYFESNWFDHTEPLPSFYWDSSQTDLNCLKHVLSQVEETGYAHHIQRLMILSNFALIFGVSPQAIENWFHAAFIDAYDWVMQTNVIGMGQFADGGLLASKPYGASANYIDKMSNYCQNCTYDKKAKTGDKACPFNVFYWDFLARHHDKLRSQGRMNLVLSHLKKMSDQDLNDIQQLANQLRQSLLQ